MKKIILRISLVAGLLVSITSCAFHNGAIQSSAVLSNNNFKYVKRDVRGSSVAHYVVGFGGLSKDELVAEAKKDLISTNKIQGNQTIVNLTIGWKRTIVFPLVVTNRCIVTADIVEFQ
jgi:hypothetical protein